MLSRSVLPLALALCATPLAAQVTNDECATASQISNGSNPLLSTAGATPSAGLWTCGTGNRPDVWHFYRAQCTGTLTIDTCGAGTNFDTVLQLFTGSCGLLTILDCDDDTCGTRSSVTARVTLGANYYLRVGGVAGASGAYDLNVVCNGTTQVPNDECSGAIQVFGGRQYGLSNAGATTSFAWPCAGGGSDVWFRYVAPCTGRVIIDTCSSGTNYDSSLEAFSGTCTNLASLACNDDTCGLTSGVMIGVTQGTTYYIRVGGHNASTGLFDLTLSCSPTISTNDECTTAIPITAGVNGPFNTTLATTSAPPWPCGGGGNDIWFSYDAGCAGTVVFDTCPYVNYDTTLQIFSGTCAALVSVGCNDDSCGLSSSASIAATPGRYYVRVGGHAAARGVFVLSVMPPTGIGSFQNVALGCGPTTLTPSGTPNLGTTVGFALGNTSGTPVIWLGAPTGILLCPPAICWIGASFDVVVPSSSIQVPIPCLPGLVGRRVAIQGADIGGPVGCSAGTVVPVSLNLSPTLVATIG